MGAVELAWLKAFYRVEPHGDDWLQAGVVAREVRNLREHVLPIMSAFVGVDYQPKFVSAGEMMPGGAKPQRAIAPRRRSLTPAEAEAIDRARYGGKG